MNYSNYCSTCGAQIFDDLNADKCAACRLIPGSSEDGGSRGDRSGGSTLQTWILGWFVIGLVWYLFDLAELSADRDGWLLYVEALRPVSYGEFGIKSLGVVVGGFLVVRRFIPSVTSFLASLIRAVAIGAAVFIGIAIVVNPTVQTEIKRVGTELSDWADENIFESDVVSDAEEDGVAFIEVATPLATEPKPIQPKDLTSVVQLRSYVLGLINDDRVKHGFDPVVLGTNTAAQDHANDMLTFGYLGHWWVDGKKPYMAYSQAGGTSYVAENAAVAGHKIAGYLDNDCSKFFSLCEDLDPVDQLTKLQYAMVYDDADSNWGHRDTMLDPAHSEVSIGVAFDDEFISLVQHFSGGDARTIAGPTIAGGTLSMEVELLAPEIEVFRVISVWWEPLPSPREPADIGALRSYCVGGDFTAECGDPLFSVYPPAPRGKFYVDLGADEIVAGEWGVEGSVFSFEAEVPAELMRSGVYTVGVLRDQGGEFSDGVLVMLSTRWVE